MLENEGVSQAEVPVTTFEALRGRLFGLAYRMLGSRADAEDIVQDTYLRWHGVAHDRIENSEAWLVTTATRLAIDRLRRLKTEREAYVGPWLPEPIVTDAAPDRHLDLADDLSMAFLMLLERLAPEERAAFDEAELVALTFGVIVINSWNRLSVSFRPPVGSYQPAAAAAV
jgi:RNA polymerase sigma-70 factor (ECF subfamily)